MPTIREVLDEMEQYMIPRQEKLQALGQLRRQNFATEAAYERRRAALMQEVADLEREMETLLRLFEREPDRLSRTYAANLARFNQDGQGTYEDFVFIMTKFPEPNDQNPEKQKLLDVIRVLQDEVQSRGYKPRIAWERDYTRWLFGNVELFLCGCARGIAIVEDKYLPELNPNVAIEWGWMTGMGRDVLYLREENFQHQRADWAGLINYSFDWDNPKPGIQAALEKFLPQRP